MGDERARQHAGSDPAECVKRSPHRVGNTLHRSPATVKTQAGNTAVMSRRLDGERGVACRPLHLRLQNPGRGPWTGLPQPSRTSV
ncbi:hypothetical protein SAM23877_1089 [Streptomyces ambofaciens ATCC 23877]|uniref:Uncharacterized protein n=1 Tax=Streptomyces ambofaciens (strain ATCC 23877 / 3486 / DSM 40053 / JCM 4204 / NBRC 12836 / NRRL B-2516) TaxID=278992 RepID=A0A0K2AMB5_STRA7|nr:hypothetical protein SAM23877_1089 [Streptomyces ambofaciens ATCC 23877]